MERRKFVEKTAVLTTAIMAFGGTSAYASIDEKKSGNLDLSPLFISKEKIVIKGFVKDFKTRDLITNAQINVLVKRNRFFPLNRNVFPENGTYSINSGFANSNRKTEKLQIKITANGYKTYNGCLYLGEGGCRIHSNEWVYNPNYKPAYCPDNIKIDDHILSKFNFYLIKK